MNLAHSNETQLRAGPDSVATVAEADRPMSVRKFVAFTLLELLVVIAIIAIVTGIALPAIRNLTQTKGISVANRQLLDDFALARSIALGSRSTVYVIFVPTNIWMFNTNQFTNTVRPLLNELVAGQYTTYALYAKRSVGEQPGQEHPRYLTEWKTLPEGIYIPEVAFDNTNTFSRGFFNFPTVESPIPIVSGTNVPLHYIAFNSQGQLITGVDAVIPLTQGSIWNARNADNTYVMAAADIKETPPGNFTNNFNHVRLYWLTGRGKIEKAEIQ